MTRDGAVDEPFERNEQEKAAEEYKLPLEVNTDTTPQKISGQDPSVGLQETIEGRDSSVLHLSPRRHLSIDRLSPFFTDGRESLKMPGAPPGGEQFNDESAVGYAAEGPDSSRFIEHSLFLNPDASHQASVGFVNLVSSEDGSARRRREGPMISEAGEHEEEELSS